MYDFACGMIAMGYLVASVFFMKFWFRTRDFLFAIFALAFGLLAAHETLLSLLGIRRETTSLVFLLRFFAFLLIAIGIILKNVSARTISQSEIMRGMPGIAPEQRDATAKPGPGHNQI